MVTAKHPPPPPPSAPAAHASSPSLGARGPDAVADDGPDNTPLHEPVHAPGPAPGSALINDLGDALEPPGEPSPARSASVQAHIPLPHERDQDLHMTDAEPNARVLQAAEDLQAGRKDTSRATEAEQAYQKIKAP